MGDADAKHKFCWMNELITMAKDLEVIFITCTTSMEMMGISKDAFMSSVDSYVGVATYLTTATESKIYLFI
jgi:peroxiredoxin family protein